MPNHLPRNSNLAGRLTLPACSIYHYYPPGNPPLEANGKYTLSSQLIHPSNGPQNTPYLCISIDNPLSEDTLQAPRARPPRSMLMAYISSIANFSLRMNWACTEPAEGTLYVQVESIRYERRHDLKAG